MTKSARNCGLVTFSEEIRNGKLHFLCSVCMMFGVNVKQGKIIRCKHFYRSNIIVHHAGLTRSYISTLQDGNTVDFSNNEDYEYQFNKTRYDYDHFPPVSIIYQLYNRSLIKFLIGEIYQQQLEC